MNKTLNFFMFCYYFYPEVSGGIRRPMLLQKYLPENGIIPTVITPVKSSEKFFGQKVIHISRPNFLEPNIPIFKFHKLTTNKQVQRNFFIKGLRTFVRQWLIYPDIYVFWVFNVLKNLRSKTLIIPDWIYTTSPPDSSHLIGLFLKKKWKCKWIADFRDSWVSNGLKPELKNPIRRKIERFIEKSVIKKADIITCTTQNIKDDLILYYPKYKSKIYHWSNGFDPDPEIEDVNLDRSKFNLVHTGKFSLSDKNRSPINLFKAISEIIKENNEFYKNFNLILIGELTVDEINSMKSLNIENNVSILGVVDYFKSLGYQKSADVLLIITSPNCQEHIPGKLYEYMYTKNPILVLSNNKEIINKVLPLNYGLCAKPDSVNDIKIVLLKFYQMWKNNLLKQTFLYEYSKDFDGRNLVKIFSNFLTS